MTGLLWPDVLSRLNRREHLSADEAASAMREIMSGDATPAQIGGFLMALRTKGETVDEIEGLARATLEFAQRVRAPEGVIDTCGTGGDRAGTISESRLLALQLQLASTHSIAFPTAYASASLSVGKASLH